MRFDVSIVYIAVPRQVWQWKKGRKKNDICGLSCGEQDAAETILDELEQDEPWKETERKKYIRIHANSGTEMLIIITALVGKTDCVPDAKPENPSSRFGRWKFHLTAELHPQVAATELLAWCLLANDADLKTSAPKELTRMRSEDKWVYLNEYQD